MEWVVADANGRQAVVPIYGVGQVCCKPEFRNRGVMSGLLNASAQQMRERGNIIGCLSGRRFRYMHFGYDFGGSRVTYSLDKRQFEQPAPDGFSLRKAAYADWHELDAAYSKLPSRVLRDARAWERQFMRENYAWYIAGLNGNKAYAAVRDNSRVTEIYGDADAAKAMLAELFIKLNRDNMTVDYGLRYEESDELERMIYNEASYMQVGILGQFAVFDAPRFIKILKDAGFDMSNVKPGDEREHALRMLRHIHQPLPFGTAGVKPLCAWIADADNI
jgi:predicted acetyltransferase